MRILDGRTMTGFAVGAGVAVVCTVAGASFAQQPFERAPRASAKASVVTAAAPAPLVTAACADKKTGVITIIGSKHKSCTSKEKAVAFATSATGPAGPPGPQGPSGSSILLPDGSLALTNGATFTSPNGLYQLVISDSGVGYKGPGGSVVIDGSAIHTFDSTGKEQ